MKRFVLFLALILVILAPVVLSEDYDQILSDAGYQIYEAGPVLLLMTEVGDNASINNPDMFPGLDDDNPAILNYVNTFERVLVFVLKQDAIYFGADLKTPISSGQASVLFSQEAIGEMFTGLSVGE